MRDARWRPFSANLPRNLQSLYGVLTDEPVEHVEKDNVWLFHADQLVCFTNPSWLICKENIGEGRICCDYVRLSFWLRACVAFKLSCLFLDVHMEKSGTSSTFFGKGK